METRCCRIARDGSKSIARHRETALEGSSGAYSNVIIEYLKKGYISKVSPSEKDEKAWYLPHFAIVRPENTTTKTRVVFDASAKCNGVSLNDFMPKLQRDTFHVLLRFRRFPTALVCNITEMYLRIGMEPSSRLFIASYGEIWISQDLPISTNLTAWSLVSIRVPIKHSLFRGSSQWKAKNSTRKLLKRSRSQHT